MPRAPVTFTTDASDPEPLQETGRAVGIDLGVTDFAVTSGGEKIANLRHLGRKARRLARYQRRLARSADTIIIEDLNVCGMVRNRHLARVIADCGWGEFRRQLEYKCKRYGRDLVVIDRWCGRRRNRNPSPRGPESPSFRAGRSQVLNDSARYLKMHRWLWPARRAR